MDNDQGPENLGSDKEEPAEEHSDHVSGHHEEEVRPEHNHFDDSKAAKKSHWWQRFLSWYKGHKKWSIPATVVVLLLILGLVPFTRYQAAGLVFKKNYSIQVTDSVANNAVSGADVSIGGVSGTTDGSGKVTLHGVKVGNHQVVINKKYYQNKTVSLLVPIMKQKTTPDVSFVATGRQVKIVVSNLINSKKLDGVDIEVADTQAKTDSSGTAFVVLPANATTEKAALKLAGYNDTNVTIQISNSSVKENDYKMTPAGKVYFLSKLSGTIDVVKTNLDGSNRQTVMAGTGNEDDQNTVLLASRDWKYLALLSKRSGDNPSIYLIDTSTDKSTVIDSGEATFTLVGWSNDTFVYQVQRTNIQNWQANQQAIKSYNATNGKLTVLDQTTASGTGDNDWIGESFGNPYIIGSQLVYATNWGSSYNGDSSLQITGKQATLNSINVDGTNSKTIKSFGLDSGTYSDYVSITTQLDTPSDLYIEFSSGTNDHFYEYSNGQVTNDSNLSDENFYETPYSTYLLSPSGQQTFWSEQRDGKNTLFVGDQNGSGGKQIDTLSDYDTYGWFTDDYLLVSKDSSELYIMPATGYPNGSQPIKITDYHKPSQNFIGYGGGYGGL